MRFATECVRIRAGRTYLAPELVPSGSSTAELPCSARTNRPPRRCSAAPAAVRGSATAGSGWIQPTWRKRVVQFKCNTYQIVPNVPGATVHGTSTADSRAHAARWERWTPAGEIRKWRTDVASN